MRLEYWQLAQSSERSLVEQVMLGALPCGKASASMPEARLTAKQRVRVRRMRFVQLLKLGLSFPRCDLHAMSCGCLPYRGCRLGGVLLAGRPFELAFALARHSRLRSSSLARRLWQEGSKLWSLAFALLSSEQVLVPLLSLLHCVLRA